MLQLFRFKRPVQGFRNRFSGGYIISYSSNVGVTNVLSPKAGASGVNVLMLLLRAVSNADLLCCHLLMRYSYVGLRRMRDFATRTEL